MEWPLIKSGLPHLRFLFVAPACKHRHSSVGAQEQGGADQAAGGHVDGYPGALLCQELLLGCVGPPVACGGCPGRVHRAPEDQGHWEQKGPRQEHQRGDAEQAHEVLYHHSRISSQPVLCDTMINRNYKKCANFGSNCTVDSVQSWPLKSAQPIKPKITPKQEDLRPAHII